MSDRGDHPAARPRWVVGDRRGDPYAGIPGRRIFVAAPLPALARERIEALVARVRAAGDPTRPDVRWVRLDGLHVTLRFIGPTLEDRIPDAQAALAAAAADGASFEASLRGAGAFPTPDRPRALWIGIDHGAEALGELAARLSAELAERGWPVDDRPFRAHLTLARSDGIATGPAVAARLREAAEQLSLSWTVDRLVLYESVTGGGPARYLALDEAILGD